MVLVNTSVWFEHFRSGNIRLKNLLNNGSVAIHQFIIGELACGNLTNRTEILSHLQLLLRVNHAEHDEVKRFIENQALMGKGLRYINTPLLASAMLGNEPL